MQGKGGKRSFHFFPKNGDLRQEWIRAVGREVGRHACICSDHFNDTSYKSKKERYDLLLEAKVV